MLSLVLLWLSLIIPITHIFMGGRLVLLVLTIGDHIWKCVLIYRYCSSENNYWRGIQLMYMHSREAAGMQPWMPRQAFCINLGSIRVLQLGIVTACEVRLSPCTLSLVRCGLGMVQMRPY